MFVDPNRNKDSKLGSDPSVERNGTDRFAELSPPKLVAAMSEVPQFQDVDWRPQEKRQEKPQPQNSECIEARPLSEIPQPPQIIPELVSKASTQELKDENAEQERQAGTGLKLSEYGRSFFGALFRETTGLSKNPFDILATGIAVAATTQLISSFGSNSFGNFFWFVSGGLAYSAVRNALIRSEISNSEDENWKWKTYLPEKNDSFVEKSKNLYTEFRHNAWRFSFARAEKTTEDSNVVSGLLNGSTLGHFVVAPLGVHVLFRDIAVLGLQLAGSAVGSVYKSISRCFESTAGPTK